MAQNRETNIRLIQKILGQVGISFVSNPSGREIVFGQKKIQINHNGYEHWTIRIPGLQGKDGIRLPFNVSIKIENGLFIINETLAIKYDI
jgi:hypothetical protein